MLVDARLGQGKFRRAVELLWGESCSVSGCSVPEVLRASHIKPWKSSTDRERLDGHNGLLLTADLDALFDRGLISFADDGEMLVSGRLAKSSDWSARFANSRIGPSATTSPITAAGGPSIRLDLSTEIGRAKAILKDRFQDNRSVG